MITNQRAADVDQDYIARTGATGVYPLMFYPHNLQFVAVARAAPGPLCQRKSGGGQTRRRGHSYRHANAHGGSLGGSSSVRTTSVSPLGGNSDPTCTGVPVPFLNAIWRFARI
ncbi:MAG TPA: hypothetical protein VM715_08780, partial [Candidatus Acidoferrum sp.]|nr:hypothetical protein [Candidatus Acidoferrum sp.]